MHPFIKKITFTPATTPSSPPTSRTDMTSFTSFIDDLKDIEGLNDLTSGGASSPTQRAARETFPCESCGGTGKYRGVRLHQQATECFACKGRGFFYTSTKDRYAKRQHAAARKLSKKEQAQATFKETHPGLIEKLHELASWNDFAGKMLQSFSEWDGLTDRQVDACQRMIDKVEAGRAARDAQKRANSGEVDTSKIEEMFNTAKASGLSKLAFVAAGLKIKPAKAHSVNAGALYVTAGRDAYQGKIAGGRFYPISGAEPGTLATLIEIAANPSQAARDYGKRTGVCCCCGRELTDPVSVAAGIGPICASNWGL